MRVPCLAAGEEVVLQSLDQNLFLIGSANNGWFRVASPVFGGYNARRIRGKAAALKAFQLRVAQA